MLAVTPTTAVARMPPPTRRSCVLILSLAVDNDRKATKTAPGEVSDHMKDVKDEQRPVGRRVLAAQHGFGLVNERRGKR